MKQISKIALKALVFINEGNSRFSFRRFAEHLWPDSLMHRRSYNTGHGACRGKGAWLAAGSYVARLEKMGLVRQYGFGMDHKIYLTELGLESIGATK